MFSDIEIKENLIKKELGHSDCLKIYVHPCKIYVDPGF